VLARTSVEFAEAEVAVGDKRAQAGITASLWTTGFDTADLRDARMLLDLREPTVDLSERLPGLVPPILPEEQPRETHGRA
jgi:hypothetical protein